MAVLKPLKVVILNYPPDQVEQLEAVNNPEDPEMGTRQIPFSSEIYIDCDDFREDPPRKYFRLAPGREVRLKHAYIIKCEEVVRDQKSGEILELRCSYDPETKSGQTSDGRKVKGTLHWLSAKHALPAEIRLYDHLFLEANHDQVEEGDDFLSNLNPNSLEVLKGFVEPSLASVKGGDRFQFLRTGYFCVDSVDSKPDHLVFNRTVSLRDTWARIEKAQNQKR
jgi:glutaminyl-tRNA synthetase